MKHCDSGLPLPLNNIWRLMWLFFMQPVLLHNELRNHNIDSDADIVNVLRNNGLNSIYVKRLYFSIISVALIIYLLLCGVRKIIENFNSEVFYFNLFCGIILYIFLFKFFESFVALSNGCYQKFDPIYRVLQIIVGVIGAYVAFFGGLKEIVIGVFIGVIIFNVLFIDILKVLICILLYFIQKILIRQFYCIHHCQISPMKSMSYESILRSIEMPD